MIPLQVLEHEGLDRFIDPRYLQREIAEANDMTEEELDRAARELIASRSPAPAKLPYYDHMGGYSMHDMKDYNQYSQQDDLVPPRRNYSDELSDEADDQMVYVTTL